MLVQRKMRREMVRTTRRKFVFDSFRFSFSSFRRTKLDSSTQKRSQRRRFRRNDTLFVRKSRPSTIERSVFQFRWSNFQDRMFSCRHLVTGDPVEMRLRLTAQNSTDSPNFFHLVKRKFFLRASNFDDFSSGESDRSKVRRKNIERRNENCDDLFFCLFQLRLLELSGLKLIGRNYYQFDRKIDLERYRLTLFPGFLTNVNIYEGSLMINVDLSHKVLNKTTVFNRLQDIFTQFVEFVEFSAFERREKLAKFCFSILVTKERKTNQRKN